MSLENFQKFKEYISTYTEVPNYELDEICDTDIDTSQKLEYFGYMIDNSLMPQEEFERFVLESFPRDLSLTDSYLAVIEYCFERGFNDFGVTTKEFQHLANKDSQRAKLLVDNDITPSQWNINACMTSDSTSDLEFFARFGLFPDISEINQAAEDGFLRHLEILSEYNIYPSSGAREYCVGKYGYEASFLDF